MTSPSVCVAANAGSPSPSLASASPAPATASGAPPPTAQQLSAHMLLYAARLPPRALPGVSAYAPSYQYDGCDYALALAACFPVNCIDLTELNWSPRPLPAQRAANLRAFCDAALRLRLPDAPLSALRPELLVPEPACLVHHLKVQHWLHSLARRFPPDPAHSAAALRAELRHRQTGEPFIGARRARGEGEAAGGGPSDFACPDLRRARCVEASIAALCTPALTPLPPPCAAGASDKPTDAPARGKAEAAKAAARGPSAKPWLSYSKPWRLPAIEAAKAKREEAAVAAQRRQEELRSRDPCLVAFATHAQHVEEQYAHSQLAARKFADQLSSIRADVMTSIIAGEPLDYAALGQRLRDVGIVPVVE